MTDEHATLKGRYEAQPYGGQAYRATHPDRLAAVARLVGIDAPDVATARILEIGCGDGFNLVAMADGLPDARLVGVDLSDEILAPGRRCAEAVGLDNLELVAGGLPDLPVPTGEFDYVIAHGVYSWLPPDVLETAMDQIARALAPNGLAYVSFNAYPGWHLRMLAREMMRMEVRVDDERSAAEQVGRAQALLDYVSEELGENGHHALVLKYAASQLKGRSETYLFHDYLAPFNTPMTFTEFAGRAGRAGLAYVGECKGGAAAVGAMSLPDTLVALLDAETDVIRREQMLDHFRNTGFRRSVLCHASRDVDSEFPPAGALASLHLGIRGFAKSEIDLAPGVPADFAAQGDVEITCHSPSVKAALQILAERHPATVPFDDLVGHIADRLPKHWSDVEELPANLVQLFGLELVDFLPRERRLSVCKSADHGPPIAVGLARWQAASGSESVVNGYHEHIDLSPLQRRILMRCDGAHGLDEIAAGITGDVLAGVLSLHLDGDEVMDAALVLEAVTLAVPQEVERLGWMGLTLRAE